jgi:hypothetical protein
MSVANNKVKLAISNLTNCEKKDEIRIIVQININKMLAHTRQYRNSSLSFSNPN